MLQCGSMATPSKRQVLKRHGSLNATPEAIRAESFTEHPEFFDPEDKLQVRYEMLRAPSKGEMTVSQACRDFAVSRQTFYQVKRAFEAEGVAGLAEHKRGRKGPLKASVEVVEFLQSAKAEDPGRSGADLAAMVAERFGIQLHRRTAERLLRQKKKPSGMQQAP